MIDGLMLLGMALLFWLVTAETPEVSIKDGEEEE